ncbi:DUF2784 domain-containing protein [Viridibacterium curvum]|uniref:DUF2784 domain-containing protein n=1 Tax=Viridibacterium curvum TaxID=1101404 RepID=A0ABP9R1F3_9RHOO
MLTPQSWQLLANLTLILHIAIVLFVVGGLLLVLVGNLRGWRWVNALWFRLVHLATILFVVLESWVGVVCPLTTLEMWLRRQARQEGYAGGFIEHWLQSLLYFNAPPWVFTLAYSLFGLAVLASWWYFPPRSGRKAPRA